MNEIPDLLRATALPGVLGLVLAVVLWCCSPAPSVDVSPATLGDCVEVCLPRGVLAYERGQACYCTAN